MKAITIPDKIVRFYPYRSAIMFNWCIQIELSQDDIAYLGRKLQRSGYHMDNHICFSTEKSDYFYSDGKLSVGGELNIGRW